MLERYSHLSPEHCVDHIDRLAPPSPAPQRPRRDGDTGGNEIETRPQERS